MEASLAVLNRQQLLRRLAANLDDFYVFSNPPEGVEVVCHPLLPDPVFVYARVDHPLAAMRGLEFRALASEPFLVREPGSGARMVAEQVFAEHGVRPPIRMELGSNAAIREAIRGGLGLSILSAHAMGPDSRVPARPLVASRVRGGPAAVAGRTDIPRPGPPARLAGRVPRRAGSLPRRRPRRAARRTAGEARGAGPMTSAAACNRGNAELVAAPRGSKEAVPP
jgi:DNA-binding transcriptional LysR family regulator